MEHNQETADLAARMLGLKVKDFNEQHVRFEDPSYFFSIPWKSVVNIAKLSNVLRAALGLSEPFICGVSGEVDSLGLPEYLQVCPFNGLDGFAVYKKHTDYDAPGY